MFTQFQSMFSKVKSAAKQVQDKVQSQVSYQQSDYAGTPQLYNISGRQLQQIKLLSQGAFGFIWLAQDIKTKQQFAIKRVICQTQQRVRQAKRQKQVMSVLPKSQNIVQYYGGDIISRSGQKVVVTVMQLCDGGTLFNLLQKRQNKGFPEQQLIKIMLEIMKGLQSVHSTGYYHRDVKIENVLLGKDRHYKLCDFGSCTKQIYNFAQISKNDYDTAKEEIQALTTPMYRPPEIVDPYLKYKVDCKADIWMAGCVLYTLSYFTHPFIDSNAIGIAAGTYRFPKHPQQTVYKVSDKIKDLIRHLLTPNPAYRPGTTELIELLKNWDNIVQVPLNSEAIRRKKQQSMKQLELQKLNKKCVDFDGDIPIEKLMELQKRLKKTDEEEKPASFVNKKGLDKIKDQNSYNNKINSSNLQKDSFRVVNNGAQKSKTQVQNNLFNSKDPFGSVAGQTKKQTSVKDLWGGDFGVTPLSTVDNKNSSLKVINKSSETFFDSFGAPTTKLASHNTLNFQQMFSQTPLQKSQVKQHDRQSSKSKQIDLLSQMSRQNKSNSNTNQSNLLDF